jgi:hypothetical protein
MAATGDEVGELEGADKIGAEVIGDEVGNLVVGADEVGGVVSKFDNLLRLDEGAFIGLAEGVELSDFVGPSVGDKLVLGLLDGGRLGDLEGLLIIVVAAALNSSLLTAVLIVPDTPDND